MSSDRISSKADKPTQTSEERLAAITVGERTPLNNTIRLVDYDPEWPTRFSWLATRVREAVSGKLTVLEHVGSTSVLGLCAKPIIDMVLAVADSSDESSYVPALEARGFVLVIREPDWYEHRCLKFSDPDAHLHVFSSGCPEVDRMLAFRNRLRLDDVDRQLYEEAKRALASQTWKHVQNYADAKSEIVRMILERSKSNLGASDDRSAR